MHCEPPAFQITSTDDLQSLLRLEHERLEGRFDELLCAIEADAHTEVPPLWCAFDRELRAHLTFEERHLLPRFLEIDAREALVLMREHDRIREKLTALAISIDLHYARYRQVADFVSELRSHAAREDALFYRWSEEHARDGALREAVKRRLNRTA